MLHAGLPYCRRLIVTRRDFTEAAALAEDYGFSVLLNEAPERGMGSSVAVAAAELLQADVDGALFAVCDQPFLRAAAVERLLEDFCGAPDRIVSLACGGERGNPCVFPGDLLPELAALDGDGGGAAVIARHRDRLVLTQIEDAAQLKDIDTPPEGL